MIVVTGATGQLGSQVVHRLLEQVPASEVGVSVRDPARAADLAARGVRVRAGDHTRPEGLAEAFAGARQVLVVSTPLHGDAAVAANCAALDAACDAGAERVLYTSHQAASRTSLFAAQPTHAATEEHLAGLGVPFTALRNGFYASTLAFLTAGALESGQLVAPADGPVSWTAHGDLADAAVAALTEEGRLDGVTPPLTAPEMLDLAAVAAVLGELGGRPVTRVVVDDEEWRASAVGRGMPPAAAEFTLGIFRAARRGEFAVTDGTLEAVIGRPPQSARSVLAALVGA